MENGATAAEHESMSVHSTTEKRRNSVASGSDRNPIIIGGLPSQVPDFDPEETQEWLDSLDAAVDERGRERARYLMLRLIERAREKRVAVPEMRSTDYVNTIATKDEPFFPGNEEIERKILNATRWNAAVMVSRAQRPGIGVGGHIATFASSASLYDVGFNHFFRARTTTAATRSSSRAMPPPASTPAPSCSTG
ncbi:hypothetical protein SVIO_039160 [Streptomyces violaceusniger]|uniref:Pyruvate dehydrogenase E1 component middle domain-containing protein n=1 Tax=Streptomyces violaceusniger TaxID=68280 RepID=A0A4D4L5N2_STRVO|nr:hypothetical protein SVIO_039160 [Streptomyces violaceusniger]